MVSNGWQNNQEFPYAHDIKCNVYVESVTHSSDSIRVVGKIGAVNVEPSGYYAWYNYPVYVTPEGGSKSTLLAGYERVYGGGTDNAKTVNFDVTLDSPAASTSRNFSISVNMNNGTATGTLTWSLNFDASATPPSGGSVSFVTATWNSVTLKGKVSNWGQNYTAGSATRHFAVMRGENGKAWTGRKEKNIDGNSIEERQVTISNNSYDTSYDGGINILGCTPFKIGMWFGTSAGSDSVGDYTIRRTPPAPLTNIELVSTKATNTSYATAILDIYGSATNNTAGQVVFTQYRFSVDDKKTWSEWKSSSTAAPPEKAYRAELFGLPQNRTIYIQARQFQSGGTIYSEVLESSFLSAQFVPTISYFWDEQRHIITAIGTAGSNATSSVLLWGTSLSAVNSVLGQSTSNIVSGSLANLAHGEGQMIYLRVRAEYIDGTWEDSAVEPVSVPNPILGIARDTTKKYYIVDIVEHKANNTVTTRWQNTWPRFVKKP